MDKYFNPRSPDGERLRHIPFDLPVKAISIHAPRMGSDRSTARRCAPCTRFQSTLPGWGATLGSAHAFTFLLDFNPRSPDGERPRHHDPGCGTRYDFNPRSPDGERLIAVITEVTTVNFNPRSPDGERLAVRSPKVRVFAFQSTLPGWGATAGQQVRHALAVQFQSTLPGWGATDEWRNPLPTPQNFNPRSPDGERRGRRAEALLVAEISIHAPRMGSDDMMQCIIQPNGDFNPRSPDGERQVATSKFGQFLRISIHAPRMGSDLFQHALPDAGHDFNPRSPDGERPTIPITATALYTFQSTLPGWGATSPLSNGGK